ncbi:hypothetical protein C2S51_004712 [Perilla frutescens var. frutescens]|nr:hypothetical protein C2S51_004712 [Perilla frutescens var. frutescens]
MKDTFWVEESSVQSSVCKKRKRRVGKRKIEFIGWGSRPLIEFLEAIGKDTGEKHSRQEVAAFINKYVNEKNLASAEKKKKIICDERLFALFGKKSVPRIKVFDMLEEHFAENHDDSDDDEFLDSSDEDYGEKKSFELKKNPTGQMKKALKIPKSCFAAVIPENIKLIYLKKSVIQELQKFPESFEFKIMGSFVRMKSDPNDIYQKNRFQLQQVTGLEKVSVVGDADIEIHLRVSNFFKDVPICMLSDDNFSEEEVEDIQDRIKAGSLNRLTVNELQQKAQVLHADITKNWIAKEISLLQKRAEHANEKGWQREYPLICLHLCFLNCYSALNILKVSIFIVNAADSICIKNLEFTKFEYLERRKMLQKPSEQEKLLFKLPEVIAEELEPEVAVADDSEKEEINACSPKSILRGSSDVSSTDASGSGEIGTPPKVILGDPHALTGEIDTPPKVISGDPLALKVQNGGIDGVVHVPLKDPKAEIGEQGKLVPNLTYDESSREMQMQGVGSGEKHPQGEPEQRLRITGEIHGGSSREMQQQVMGSREKGKAEQRSSTTVVIELSDDESEEDDGVKSGGRRNGGENPNEAVWHYVDPQGQIQGPFPLCLLKRWSDANYFYSGFTVWKSGQTPNDGVLLVDVLHRTFP